MNFRMKAALIFLLGFFVAQPAAAASAEAGFWTWFQANEDAYFKLDPRDESSRERLFDELSAQLEQVDPDLTFEFGPVVDGRRDFVISAAGIKRAFPAVESLAKQAPNLPHWRVIAFRPRRHPVNNLEFANLKLDPRKVFVQLSPDGDKTGLVVYMRMREAASSIRSMALSGSWRSEM